MFLVGIIENKSNTMEIREILKEKEIADKCNIIEILESNIFNYRNIKFDVIVINNEIKINKANFNNINNKKNKKDCNGCINDNKSSDSNIIMKKILKNAKRILLNIDYKNNLQIVDNLSINVITYGFNRKATITINSNEEDNIILEIQREIIGLNNSKIKTAEIRKERECGKNRALFTN